MTILPDPYDETEDTIRERCYDVIDAIFPVPALRPDLREGSLIDTILAPMVAEMARYYDNLNQTMKRAFIQTAEGPYLDAKGEELSRPRNEATGSTGTLRFYGDGTTVIPVNTTVSTTTEDPDANTHTYDTDSTALGVAIPPEDRTITATADPVARNEVQWVKVIATSGNFTLTYAGQTTANIAYDADATTGATSVRARLEDLSNIEPGDVTVTGGPGNGTGSLPYEITFEGTLAATDVAQITATNVSLGGPGNAVTTGTTVIGSSAIPTLVVVPVNEVQTLAKTGTVTSGTYKLTFNAVECGATIAYDDNIATIQTRLESIATIGAGNVSVTGGPLSSGNNVLIEFRNALGRTDVGAITVTSSALVGGGSYAVTGTTAGVAGNGTNVTGDVRYQYTYVTPVGDPSDDNYDEGYGETIGSPTSATKTLVNQSVVITIPPVPVLTGLNEVKLVNIYRSLDDGGGYSDYTYLGYVTASTSTSMTYTDNLDAAAFASISEYIPEENTTGVVDLASTCTPTTGADTNAAPNTITLAEDVVSGVVRVTNRDAFTGGSDTETDDAYRTRLLEEISKVPGAGNIADYISWGKETDGVSYVSVIPEWQDTFALPAGLGPGSVKVVVSDATNSPLTYTKIEEVRQNIAGDIAIVAPYTLSTPKPTVAVGGAGSIPAGDYYYAFTWVNTGGGETPYQSIDPSTGLEVGAYTSSVVTVNGSQEVDLSAIAVGPVGSGPENTAHRRIYRRKSSEAYYTWVHTLEDNVTTTWTDDYGVSTANLRAPVVNSTSKYNGQSPIGAQVTVETITEVTITVAATIIPETGYNLTGTSGNLNLANNIYAALDAAIRSIGAGDTLYMSDIHDALHDCAGVKDFRSVTMTTPTNCTVSNSNIIPGASNIKILYGTAGVLTEAAS